MYRDLTQSPSLYVSRTEGKFWEGKSSPIFYVVEIVVAELSSVLPHLRCVLLLSRTLKQQKFFTQYLFPLDSRHRGQFLTILGFVCTRPFNQSNTAHHICPSTVSTSGLYLNPLRHSLLTLSVRHGRSRLYLTWPDPRVHLLRTHPQVIDPVLEKRSLSCGQFPLESQSTGSDSSRTTSTHLVVTNQQSRLCPRQYRNRRSGTLLR